MTDMDVHTQIQDAVAAFSQWHRPWQFRDEILQSALLDERGRAAFERIWNQAVSSPAWRSAADLAVARSKVRELLLSTDAALGAKTTDRIVQAVSYEWR